MLYRFAAFLLMKHLVQFHYLFFKIAKFRNNGFRSLSEPIVLIFSMLFVFGDAAFAQKFDVAINAGTAWYTSGIRNAKIHAAAINQNTANMDKLMNVTPFATGLGVTCIIDDPERKHFGLLAGWSYRANTFSASNTNGGTLKWRISNRRIALGMTVPVGKRLDLGFSADLNLFRFVQNAKDFDIMVNNQKTNNTNGWVYFYEPMKRSLLGNKYRTVGISLLADYRLSTWLFFRLNYMYDFDGVAPALIPGAVDRFKYNTSQLDLSVNLRFMALFKKIKNK